MTDQAKDEAKPKTYFCGGCKTGMTRAEARHHVCPQAADDTITAAKAHPAARGWTDTDDATIEEAREFLARTVNHQCARRIAPLCDIATRRGEEIKRLGDEKALIVKGAGIESGCLNLALSNAKAERDALAEEIEKLKRLKQADFDLLSVEKRALAEEAKRLREALEALTSKCEAIISDESYKSVWTIAHIHGTKYTGPNFATEIASARDALSQRECSQRREHGL